MLSYIQVGDAYIAVAGIHSDSNNNKANNSSRRVFPTDAAAGLCTSDVARNNIIKALQVSQLMQHELVALRKQLGLSLHLRIGVHCGSVVAGVIGVQRQRYCESMFTL